MRADMTGFDGFPVTDGMKPVGFTTGRGRTGAAVTPGASASPLRASSAAKLRSPICKMHSESGTTTTNSAAESEPASPQWSPTSC